MSKLNASRATRRWTIRWSGLICLASVLLFAPLAGADSGASVQERVARRDFPSVFQAWNGADNLPDEDTLVTRARHDLMWHAPGGYGLRWDAPCDGLGTSFTAESLAAGRPRRSALLALNPNMVLIMEVRYRDAPEGYLPTDSPWWLRDEQGRRKPGWEEGGFYLLNYSDPEFQAHVAAQCKAAVDSGVVDGVLLDWWGDENRDRVNLLKTVRSSIGPEPLILVNSNQRKVPGSARYVNGLFMEVYRTSTADDWQEAAETLLWAERNLLEPRVNCLETWHHGSRDDLYLMRATTTLSLTHSNGYCLFSDPNPLPTPDHLHDWYSFWDKETQSGRPKLGRPVGSRKVWPAGVVTRTFEYGLVAYNARGNGPAIARFRQPVRSTGTDRPASEHLLGDTDGDIYIGAGPASHEAPELMSVDRAPAEEGES